MKTGHVLRSIEDLPRPRGHFILGHLPKFRAGPKHLVLERWVKECGAVFRIHFAGTPFLVSADPSINDEFLKQRPEAFRRHPKITEILEEMGILGVFNAEGEQWRRLRRPTAEALNLKKVKSFYPILASKGAQLLSILERQAAENKPIEITSLVKRFTTDVTVAVAFGLELNSLADDTDSFQQHLTLIFPMLNERMSAVFPRWRWWRSSRDRAFEEALETLRSKVGDFIEDARDSLANDTSLETPPSNFLEALLVEQQDQDKFNEEEIYSAVFTLLLAGEDTTSNSISWALFFLAQHPEIVNKVRKEACSQYAITRTPVSADQHDRLTYAQAVAMETIRLKPTSPQLILQAQEETVIQGLVIPKDTNLILQNRVAQINESHFSKPQSFLPQRWLKDQCPAHFQHQPTMVKAFGGGPRYCPGKHLAIHEMVMVISSICKNFDLRMEEPTEEVKEQFTFTMNPSPFRLRLRKV